MFEKSLVRAYCNRLLDLKERYGTFSCYDRLKANSVGKNLNVTKINTKAGPPNREICLALIAHFFSESKRPHLGDANNFDYASPPFPFTLLKITNSSMCHRFFILNTSSLD